MRAWYLGRAIPWVALLGCCLVAGLAVAALHRWPDNAWAVLPLVLAACAAAAGFVFDDVATAVTSVTPRGGTWRRTSRLLAGLVPVAVWALLVATAPSELSLDASAWLLAGLAGAVAAAGAAAIGSRRQLARPGPTVAGAIVMLVLVPSVAGPFLEWEPVFPFGDYPGWVLGFWAGVLGVGMLLVGWAMRPGLRP
ncbi:MAG: hypothetical protein ACRDO4_18325 [Nocardioides sp.]